MTPCFKAQWIHDHSPVRWIERSKAQPLTSPGYLSVCAADQSLRSPSVVEGSFENDPRQLSWSDPDFTFHLEPQARALAIFFDLPAQHHPKH